MQPEGFRIRLRVGITVMFLSVMLPLTALMTTILYNQNSRLAIQLAEHAMDSATADVVSGVASLLGPMGRVADLSVAFAKAEGDSVRRVEGLRPLVEILDKFPDIYALFFGFARDGAFYEVIRVPPPGSGTTLKGRNPPQGAKYALRVIDTVDGERVDSWIYITHWGEVVGLERADKATYDPRDRPWYLAALKTSEIATSSLHVFSSIGRPGLTLSRQLATDDGQVIAVFGADLSIETLSKVLADHKIGENGQVFILDEEQRLLGHPDPQRVLIQDGSHVEIAKAEDFSDPVLSGAVKMRAAGAGDRFRAALGPDGNEYFAAFSRFPESFGKDWTIGVIAAEADFVGPLRRASGMILVIGAIFLLLSSVAVVWASRLLTQPIRALTEETDRIRNLELDHDISVRSPVVEVQSLSAGLATMKTALRSFGAYVPKSILRGIIESGIGTEIGGERRELTILFTDIAGFTRTSESMAPEDVLHHLSVYLEGMSGAIAAHNGTVDKFIGDAVMALWNAPQHDPDHVVHACRAMLACRAATAGLNEELIANNYPPMPTRYGLHTGMAVAGNVGCRDRMQYTALGAAVNLASRVESLNKHFGTEMLVTGEVEDVIRDRFVLRPLGPVVASGTSIPILLFELVGALEGEPHAANPEDVARVENWRDAFSAYVDGDWAGAAARFGDYVARYSGDKAGHLLQARAKANAADPDHAEFALQFAEK
ncbi:Adenylate cyclase [Paramagnetospirillum magnetotacticum MS-1]|uniref:Adenylate cyclase n=1 Tax=Paramagnetospirillum magnetotacticum MS-1 TaxID=272627 RepID=A0A0C2V3Z5_PARME|nr:adenylate/guanylate cyclase domain-containing protein [Paramagnetospirillum magnetotacticum]KIL99801.1 Adenylate cyclase [Paramagnetospirillum magnetotacticum MS-1]